MNITQNEQQGKKQQNNAFQKGKKKQGEHEDPQKKGTQKPQMKANKHKKTQAVYKILLELPRDAHFLQGSEKKIGSAGEI